MVCIMSDIDERLIKFFFLPDFKYSFDEDYWEMDEEYKDDQNMMVKEFIKECLDGKVNDVNLKGINKDANEIYSIFNKWRNWYKEFIDKLPILFKFIYERHIYEEINEKNAMEFIKEYSINFKLFNILSKTWIYDDNVFDEWVRLYYVWSDDESSDNERKEQELKKIKTENKQLKEENKQLKLQLEKQTLSNVLDKKIPLGTKQDINEILNSVGYTE